MSNFGSHRSLISNIERSATDGRQNAFLGSVSYGFIRRPHGYLKASALFDRPDQHQIVDRAGVGDDNPHAASEAQSFQVPLLTIEIGEDGGLEQFMGLQKSVETHTRINTDQVAQLRLGEPPSAISLRRGASSACRSTLP